MGKVVVCVLTVSVAIALGSCQTRVGRASANAKAIRLLPDRSRILMADARLVHLEMGESTHGSPHPYVGERGIDYDYLHCYPTLEAIVRAHLRPEGPVSETGTPITRHHMRDLVSLSIRNQTISNFVVFADSSLDSLRLYNCRISNFGTIGRLCTLKELHVRGCGIKDISPLKAMAGWVTYLSLANNEIKDISVLSACRELTWLDLRDNKISSISALRVLRKLTYLDLRDNVLAGDTDGDILTIKANNPGVSILLGSPPGASKTGLRQQLLARAKVAEWARCSRWHYEEGILLPMIEGVSCGLPKDISKSLTCLANSNDKEYLSDLAALFIKYAIEIESHYPPGSVEDPDGPVMKAFLDGVGLEVTDAGVPVLTLAHWILENRDKLVPSVYLDAQIDKYRELKRHLAQDGN
jgi:hypothetical protein